MRGTNLEEPPVKKIITLIVFALTASAAQASGPFAPVLRCKGEDQALTRQGEDGRFEIRISRNVRQPEIAVATKFACVSGDEFKILPRFRGFLQVTTGARGAQNVRVFDGQLPYRNAYIQNSLVIPTWIPGVVGKIAGVYSEGRANYRLECTEYAFPNNDNFPQICN